MPGDDVRRHRRVHCRGEKHRAALELARACPALPRETAWQSVYTNDFSKQGCSFLHSAVLYPGERLRLILLTGVQRTIEVAWCRRLDKNCYADRRTIHRGGHHVPMAAPGPEIGSRSEVMPAQLPELDAGLEGLLGQLASLAEDSAVEVGGQRSEVGSPTADHRPPTSDLPRRAARGTTNCPRNRRPTTAGTWPAVPLEEHFFPAAPRSLADTHVAEAEIEGIILRLLMHRGTSTGVEISQQIGLPFPITEKLLHALKTERLLVFKSAATLSDYVYEITDLGLQRARQSAVALQLLRRPCPSRWATIAPVSPRSR